METLTFSLIGVLFDLLSGVLLGWVLCKKFALPKALEKAEGMPFLLKVDHQVLKNGHIIKVIAQEGNTKFCRLLDKEGYYKAVVFWSLGELQVNFFYRMVKKDGSSDIILRQMQFLDHRILQAGDIIRICDMTMNYCELLNDSNETIINCFPFAFEPKDLNYGSIYKVLSVMDKQPLTDKTIKLEKVT